jgi:glycerol-3-phosphate acyltransferase PlsY
VPAYLALTDFTGSWQVVIFLFFMALFIVFTHRSNIQRMRQGQESKIEGVLLFRRRP